MAHSNTESLALSMACEVIGWSTSSNLSSRKDRHAAKMRLALPAWSSCEPTGRASATQNSELDLLHVHSHEKLPLQHKGALWSTHTTGEHHASMCNKQSTCLWMRSCTLRRTGVTCMHSERTPCIRSSCSEFRHACCLPYARMQYDWKRTSLSRRWSHAERNLMLCVVEWRHGAVLCPLQCIQLQKRAGF